MFVQIKPQAPSQLGKDTKYDKSYTPWKILSLHVVFDIWSDDEILKNSPCYYVTRQVYEALSKSELSGVELGGEVKTEVSETFKNLHPDKELPAYYLITIIGEPNKDDFGIAPPNNLIVSDLALTLLQEYTLNNAEIIMLP